MEILRSISLYTEGKDMPFLVIGGHAICAYGLSRQTADLDLVVPLTAKEKWNVLMQKLKYKAGQNDNRFARFRSENIGSWPIDFMYVDDTTFEKLNADSVEHNFGLSQASIVSARHLATMKIHALKHYQPDRFAKDYGDLVWLLRANLTNISPSELEELCKKYADVSLFKKLQEELQLK